MVVGPVEDVAQHASPRAALAVEESPEQIEVDRDVFEPIAGHAGLLVGAQGAALGPQTNEERRLTLEDAERAFSQVSRRSRRFLAGHEDPRI